MRLQETERGVKSECMEKPNDPKTGVQFELVNDAKTFHDSRELCTSLSGELASLHTFSQLGLAHDLLQQSGNQVKGIWVGLWRNTTLIAQQPAENVLEEDDSSINPEVLAAVGNRTWLDGSTITLGARPGFPWDRLEKRNGGCLQVMGQRANDIGGWRFTNCFQENLPLCQTSCFLQQTLQPEEIAVNVEALSLGGGVLLLLSLFVLLIVRRRNSNRRRRRLSILTKRLPAGNFGDLSGIPLRESSYEATNTSQNLRASIRRISSRDTSSREFIYPSLSARRNDQGNDSGHISAVNTMYSENVSI